MKKISWNNIFIFLFLVLFPFGQIIRINIFHPVDIVVGLAALYSIIAKLEKPLIFKSFRNLLLIFSFTFIVSIFILWDKNLYIGFLYLLRLVGYFYFLVYVWNFTKIKENRELLLNALLSISIVSAIFGWIQYFMIPDFKPFFAFGWDEHLFRLAGTFLDPTFLGLIIVFGILIAIQKFLTTKKNKYLVIILFLLGSVAFTYSRASYLALFAGLLSIGFYQKKLKKILLLIIIFGVVITLLPLRGNNTIELLRSFSAIARVENYSETLKVFQTSPLFGVGMNNICLVRQKLIGPESFSSHSCSGSDSSILLVLATTGITGLLSFIYLGIKTWRKSNELLKTLIVSLLVHSIFSNSMFYPWIMGYLIIIFAVSLRSEVES